MSKPKMKPAPLQSTSDVLYRLHELLARSLLNRLEHDVVCDKCNRGQVTTGELTMIRQFLSDNGTTGPAATPPSKVKLTDDLPAFDDQVLEPIE